MFKNKTFGTHEDILFADFGDGDIRMTIAKFVDNKYSTALLFHNQVPAKKIGEEGTDWCGKVPDELPAPALVMTFPRPESITALIHSLIELQKEVYKHAADGENRRWSDMDIMNAGKDLNIAPAKVDSLLSMLELNKNPK